MSQADRREQPQESAATHGHKPCQPRLGTATADAAGQGVQTHETDAFGVPTEVQGSVIQPFQYTGEPRDGETGFVYLRARMYDPQIGRFVQRDPLPGRVALPLSLNRYLYAFGNPIRFVDPSGFNPTNQVLGDQLFCLDPDSQRFCMMPTPGPGGTLLAGILKDILGGPEDAAGGGARAGKRVRLYRAVSPAELDDILKFGGFRGHPEGRSMAWKLFATSVEDAEWWGRTMFGEDKFHIVEASIPESLLERLYRTLMDRRPAVAVEPELLTEFNAVADIRLLR